MKKLLYLMLIGGTFFMTTAANAQFRKLSGVVTDSFIQKYLNANSERWEAKISAGQARLNMVGD